MADHPEFFNYAESLKNEQMWNDHQEWQHNTLVGKLTQSVLTWAKQSDFFGAIADALADQGGGSSPYARTLSICITISIVVVGIAGMYAIASIIQRVIGKEIIVEQKVIIETQVRLSDLMAEEEKDARGKEINEKDASKRRNKKSKNIKVQ